MLDARVTDVEFDSRSDRITAVALQFEKEGGSRTVEIGTRDIVMVTNGSQLTDISIGTMTAPPRRKAGNVPAWPLWQTLANRNASFGHPERMSGQTAESIWVSFTVTSREKRFNQLMTEFTGREAGRNGLITFRDSNWLITIVRFHQPNFIGQPEGVFLWWGYGIYPERPGNFVTKPMTECTGREVLEEVLRHLRFDADMEEIVRLSICRPCLMPHAGSVIVRRDLHDRPQVVPMGSTNFAFIGQFTEQPADVAFSMEYSIRSARTAVDRLLGLGKAPPPVYRGITRPGVVLRAIGALLR